MKKRTTFIRQWAMATALLLTMSLGANAQFGNLANKAKNAVKNSAEKAVDKAVDKAQEKAKKKMLDTVKKKVLGGKQLPDLPWTMGEQAFCDLNFMEQNGKTNVMTWLMNCGDISTDEAQALRKQMAARYAANNKILLAKSTGLFDNFGNVGYTLLNEVEAEQGRYWEFYGAIKHILNLHAYGIKVDPAANTISADLTDAGLVCSRQGGGFGVMLGATKDGNGRFLSIKRQGIYLEDEDLEKAKDAARRILNIGYLLEGVDGTQDDNVSIENIVDSKVFGETGFDTDWAFETNRAAMYTKLLATAIKSNSPENIERQAMPKAGKMNASLKAKALSLSKQTNSDVTDVVITSNSWNIQRSGGIIKCRSVSGYIITNTKHGKMAHGRSWCQDYQGGGKYGSLRNYGTGLDSFYIK